MAFQHRRTREGPAVFCFMGYAGFYKLLQIGGRKGQSFAAFCRYIDQ
jgi:hypothetical protein